MCFRGFLVMVCSIYGAYAEVCCCIAFAAVVSSASACTSRSTARTAGSFTLVAGTGSCAAGTFL